MCRDGKSQPDIHSAGIILHRNINELFQSGEFHDLVEPFAHFLPGKSQHRTVQVDVVPPENSGWNPSQLREDLPGARKL